MIAIQLSLFYHKKIFCKQKNWLFLTKFVKSKDFFKEKCAGKRNVNRVVQNIVRICYTYGD